MVDMVYVLDFLQKIVSVPSPTGSTEKAMKLIREEAERMMPGAEMKLLKKGAFVVKIPGESKEALVMDAHVDTLGAMVKEIKQNGRLAFVPIGGYLMSAVECENVLIHTRKNGEITGTILSNSQSVHVYEDARKLERKPENMEIRPDIRAVSSEETMKAGIAVGDFVSFEPRFVITETGYVKSRFLDDKAGVALLMGVLKAVADEKWIPPRTLLFYFNNTEEVGAGAANGLDHHCADFIAVDMGAPGRGQESDEFSVSLCAKDSSGPYDLSLRRELEVLAEEMKIPFKVDIYPFYGSDASAARRTRLDLRTIVLGPGVEASHAYERTHKDSLEATAALLYNLAKSER
ncbi:MAG TPA: M42 family peptidase [Firmicutes bacterium]|nr:M42 family peptidase [Bacillota bacterium]